MRQYPKTEGKSMCCRSDAAGAAPAILSPDAASGGTGMVQREFASGRRFHRPFGVLARCPHADGGIATPSRVISRLERII